MIFLGVILKRLRVYMSRLKYIEIDLDLSNIEIIEGKIITHKSPPKDYPKDKDKYADPKNYKYPVDSSERVRAAWSYINMPKNQKGYSSSEIAEIKSRIKRAGKKFGIEFKD